MAPDYEIKYFNDIKTMKNNSRAAAFIPAKDKANLFGNNHIFKTCAYCRVSTDHDEQLSSFELQQEHYKQLVSNHPNWDLKHIFADEGISATSLKNRDEFNDMISRCINGEFDLIVTKSVSRFARNLVDCVSLVRKLKGLNHPVGVFFETDNLFTLSEDSELKLSILATFAQEESVKKSESMNWSLKERFKNKKLLTPELFGYRRPRDAIGNYIKYGKLEIEESEAEIVRFIFNAFLSGFSIESICNILEDIGCKTKLGNTKWNEGSVSYILRNERYCGNVLTWKQFTADIFEHKKRKNRQDRDQYLYTDVHEAIISAEQFEAVQVLFENKKHGYKGGVPIMQVVDMGVFRGYIPINHHWISDDPEIYYKASNSVPIYKKKQSVKKNYFSRFDLSGYQVTKAELFAHTREPAVTVWENRIKFNMACLRRFPGVTHIQLLIHPEQQRLIIRPCEADAPDSLRWATGGGEKEIRNRDMICQIFAAKLFELMNWDKQYRYKMLGKPAVSDNEALYLFKLNDFELFVNTGKRKSRAYLPEDWRECFGVPVEKHEEAYKIDLAEGYISTGKAGEM